MKLEKKVGGEIICNISNNMSKLKKHIPVPSDVKVQINGNKINLEGPKGKKSLDINIEFLNITFEEGKIIVAPKDPKKQNKIIWGLQSLINNAVIGVEKVMKRLKIKWCRF